jgi:hypothetical protein
LLVGGLPKLAVVFEPFVGFGEGRGFELAGAPLGVEASGDKARSFEDFEVLGDGWLADGEGFG